MFEAPMLADNISVGIHVSINIVIIHIVLVNKCTKKSTLIFSSLSLLFFSEKEENGAKKEVK